MKRTLVLAISVLAVCVQLSAYDFMVDDLCYNKNSDGTSVTVVYDESYSSSINGSLNIPETVSYSNKTYFVTSIGNHAFYNCADLTSVTIPQTIVSFGLNVFEWCITLTRVVWNAKHCSDFEDYSYTFNQSSNINTFIIGNDVEIIPACLCYNLSGVTHINIPNSVRKIGEKAFYGCSGLTSVTIGNSVIEICEGAFNSCTGLESIEIPNSVKTIGYEAFFYCTSLSNVNIPESVTSIGSDVFSYCTKLSNITVDEANTSYDSRDNCNAIIETASNTLISGCKNTVIPNTVTSIGKLAFSGCEGLTSMQLPNSVVKIEEGAFNYCRGMTSVNIPNSVTTIESGAFHACSGLTSIDIPNSVTSIGPRAFSECSGLSGKLIIPNSISTLESEVFGRCSSLTSVSIPNSVSAIKLGAFGGCSSLSSVTIPSSVTEIGRGAFYNCTRLASVSFPDSSLKTIGTQAFHKCTRLSSIKIPDSVTEIGNYAFYECESLRSLTISDYVTSIGEGAFSECTRLGRIYSYPDPTNVTLGDGVFNNVNKNTCVLHVTPECFETYKNAPQWNEFNNILDDLAGVEGVEADAEAKTVEGYYNLQGVRIDNPERGQVSFVRYTDGTAKKVIVR